MFSFADTMRFWGKAEIKGTNDCWDWLAGTFVDGYGTFWFRNKMYRSHRVSWILTFGEIPDGLLICHRCDSPHCVNPRHLFMGTNGDNMMDASRKGRLNAPRGENHAGSKLKNEDVFEIRRLRNQGLSYSELGRKFNCSDVNIKNIIVGKKWKHI